MVILAAALILSVIFSGPFFITPKFKSVAVIYPSNISTYSEESTTEQMFQILQSHDIMDSVINKFNLPEHYKISTDNKFYKSIIYEEYGQNIQIEKTPYDAVRIEAFDKDPFMACNIVEAIIDFYNKKVRTLHNDKYFEVMEMYRESLSRKESNIDSLKKALYNLSTESGIIGYDQSAEEIMRGYLRTVTSGAAGNINSSEVKRLKENFEKVSGDLILIVESIKMDAHTYQAYKVAFEDALRFYQANLTYCNIVTHPFPADKKSSPIRWLIMAMTLTLTFFFSIVVILIVENLRVYRQKRNQNQLQH